MNTSRDTIDDLTFSALDVLGCLDEAGGRSQSGPDTATWSSEDWDRDTWTTILREVGDFARERIAPTWADTAWEPPSFDPGTGTVRMPKELQRAHQDLNQAGWWRLEAPEELGGTPAPRALAWSVTELLVAANPALYLYQAATTFLSVVHGNGTPEQRRLSEIAVEHNWGAAMVLTEADAGSDVGAIRATAEPQPDGTWHVRGVKRFITSGAHDLADNIVHLVLARPAGSAEPGTRGLSLFVVPSHHVDLETGDLLGRNGVRATALEAKMGLRASTTCELTFGADEPAVGTLLGGVHAGIEQMFQVIVHTRMLVGTKAVAALSSGQRAARDFARWRVQGTALAARGDRDATRIPIDRHPDIRQILTEARAYADGLRTLVQLVAHEQDVAERCPDPSRRASAQRRASLLLPVVKGVSAERADEQLGRLLPVLGGSGYLRDYPLEQLIRDTKVDSIYEGTTAIQADDLLWRRVVRDDRAGWRALAAEIRRTVDDVLEGSRLASAASAVAVAVSQVDDMVDVLVERVRSVPIRDLDSVGLSSRRLLLALGDVVVGWLLLRRAAAAQRLLEAAHRPPYDEALLRRQAKVAEAFALGVLPRIAADRAIVHAGNTVVMSMADEEL